MISFAWPNMVSNTSALMINDHEATASNLKLLLLSEKKSLFGDPYFGTSLRKLTFEQNNNIVRDLIIDDIYTAIITFMPQLMVNRKDIVVTSDRAKVFVNIKATNLLDYKTDLFNINLTESDEV